ncbi:heavy metal translocating P-type ATPase [Aquibacillus albus]|nr:heavy metal translocating P-type ATPase [Aquibacillus albus]
MITNNEVDKYFEVNHPFTQIKNHMELIAALFSGILILITWVFDGHMNEVTWITLNIIAFIIGGFAKAKEGMEETIENKELNVEMLMIFAAIGAASIGYWTEGAILIFIFAISGALETYTINKSEREITSLMKLQPDTALRISNGTEEYIEVAELNVGDHILVKPGERIPADGMIYEGNTSIDESTLTGEPFPISKQNSNHVFAGTVNLNGSIIVEITKANEDSLFQKIIQLVQSAHSEKSPSQLFIDKFENNYVKIVLAVVLLMMFLPHYLLGWSWTETIYRAMILLVVASPCALVASIMPATLSAISTGAKNGVLFKGGVHLENLSQVKAIAFDKTGTLTNGEPEVTDVYLNPTSSENELLSIIGSMEKQSNHPLAQAIVDYCTSKGIPCNREVAKMEDTSGQGISATVDGTNWKIGKDAFVGEKEARSFHNGIANQLSKQAKTLVFIAKETEIVGLIALKDSLRKDTIEAIKTIQQAGIYTIMLTGDNKTTANTISEEAHIDEVIANCMPEDKVNQIKHLREKYKNVAMIGDGINDAPALATANVGIAMGGGTDVALETADIVLMKNDLLKVAKAIALSNRMNKIIKQNIIFSIIVILALIATNFSQALDLPLGVIGHEGSTILVILNGLRLLKS